tara:strand:+ start:6934 stop:7164 length:231 start_codon:yes stop_codon:yes gene_type:complete
MKFRNCLFAADCTITCADGTEEKECIGFVENNKRVYKTKAGVELTGAKKPTSIKLLSILVHPMELGFINNNLEIKE